MDTVRRRRHVRRLIAEKPGAKAVFKLEKGKKDEKKKKKGDDIMDEKMGKQIVPRMYMDIKGHTAIIVSETHHFIIVYFRLSMSI